MAERVPEGYMINTTYGSSHVSDSLVLSSIENTRSNVLASQASESNGDSSNQGSCNGNRTSSEETEWVEQAEPGVYITVSSLPGGDKYLKRVRFSRKRFSEQEAEKWWAENKSKIQEKYAILTAENSTSGPASVSDSKDGLIG